MAGPSVENTEPVKAGSPATGHSTIATAFILRAMRAPARVPALGRA